jgi:hypothetical protein
MEALLVAAACYWALTAVFTFFQKKLETRVSKGYVRGGNDTPAAAVGHGALGLSQPHVVVTLEHDGQGSP